MELPADAVWRRNLWILISTIFQINCPDETTAVGGRGERGRICGWCGALSKLAISAIVILLCVGMGGTPGICEIGKWLIEK